MSNMKVLFIVIFVVLGCSTSTELVDSIVPNTIPDEVVGIDSDLWLKFVELTNLPDCDLPCWWGLRVGETSLMEVDAFLQQTDFNRAQSRSIYADIPRLNYLAAEAYGLVFTVRTHQTIDPVGDISYSFSFNDENILSAISIRMRTPSRWLPEESNPLTLRNMLLNMEQQPIIRILASENVYISEYPLFVIYPEMGLEIVYSFDFSERPDICIESENIKEIQIGITANSEQLIQPNEEGLGLMEESFTFEGVATEEFVQFFREYPDECLNLTEYNNQ